MSIQDEIFLMEKPRRAGVHLDAMLVLLYRDPDAPLTSDQRFNIGTYQDTTEVVRLALRALCEVEDEH